MQTKSGSSRLNYSRAGARPGGMRRKTAMFAVFAARRALLGRPLPEDPLADAEGKLYPDVFATRP
jgi:hypothetical protein